MDSKSEQPSIEINIPKTPKNVAERYKKEIEETPDYEDIYLEYDENYLFCVMKNDDDSELREAIYREFEMPYQYRNKDGSILEEGFTDSVYLGFIEVDNGYRLSHIGRVGISIGNFGRLDTTSQINLSGRDMEYCEVYIGSPGRGYIVVDYSNGRANRVNVYFAKNGELSGFSPYFSEEVRHMVPGREIVSTGEDGGTYKMEKTIDGAQIIVTRLFGALEADRIIIPVKNNIPEAIKGTIPEIILENPTQPLVEEDALWRNIDIKRLTNISWKTLPFKKQRDLEEQ